MNDYEIISTIFTILSFIATVGIAFLIYFLGRKNEAERIKRETQQEAKKFIQNNAEERDYLHWATIAAGCFPLNKHIRKIYNEFSQLFKDVQKEVIKQIDFGVSLIEGDEWIANKIELVRSTMKELKLYKGDEGQDYLYDNAKYFHRAYTYKTLNLDIYNDDYIFEDRFGIRLDFIKHHGKLNFKQYLDDYLYCLHSKPEKITDDAIPPMNYLIIAQHLGTADEDKVTFWMMNVINEVISYACAYLNYEKRHHTRTDAFPETFEDMYFSVLYELYYWEPKLDTKSK